MENSASSSLSPSPSPSPSPLQRRSPSVGDNFSQGDDDRSNDFDYSSDKAYSSSVSEVGAMVVSDGSSIKNEPHQGMDPKKIKRLLANRMSARRSRLRKLEYMEKLRTEIDIEEAKLSMLEPKVSRCAITCNLMKMKNREMKLQLEALEIEQAAKQAEFRALMEEREALALILKLLQQRK